MKIMRYVLKFIDCMLSKEYSFYEVIGIVFTASLVAISLFGGNNC